MIPKFFHSCCIAFIFMLAASGLMAQNAPKSGSAQPVKWKTLTAPTVNAGFLHSVAIGPEQDALLWNEGSSLHLLTRTGNQWKPWKDLGWDPGLSITCARMISWGRSRLDIFAIANGTLYHLAMDAGHLGAWENLGGTGLGNWMDLVSWSPDRIDIFAATRSGNLEHLYWDRGWGPWETLRNKADIHGYFSIKTTSWAVGRIDVFIINDDKNLLHQYYDQGWSDWEQLGNEIYFMEAIHQGINRLDLYAAIRRGEDLVLHRKVWKDFSWSAWLPLQYQVNANSPFIQAISRNGNTTDVFFDVPDQSIVHGRVNFNTGQTAFRAMSNPGSGPFTVNSSHATRMDLYSAGIGNNLYHLPWINQAWVTQ